MRVARYVQVSTSQPQQAGTIERQRYAPQQHIQHQDWALLPARAYIDDRVSGARLDGLARHNAQQWLLIEVFEKLHRDVIFLHNPFGDSPQGKLPTQMQGMITEYEQAQITERTRRGRLEKARHGACRP
jgi:DNA invertase Pin-like site-specific DNA recombinase